jgi:hypothetical protein
MRLHPSADVLFQLRDEWRRIGRSRDARRCVDDLRRSGLDLPAGVVDLADLVAALEPRGGLDQLERARMVAELLARSDDPLVRRCLLQTMLPGIVAVARQLQFGAGIADDPGTFLADALSVAVELLLAWAGQRRAYAAPDLLNALRCRLRRRMLVDKHRRSELVNDEAVLERRCSDVPLDLVRDLAHAAESGVTDVDLVYARSVLGYTARELADVVGVTTGVLHRRLVVAARPFVASS